LFVSQKRLFQQYLPISEVASLAESRLLVEFQIASVCEKNRRSTLPAPKY
jgi:hypothetical protein